MTVLREEEFDSFLKRKLGAMNGILIHGADQSAVALLSRQVVKHLNAEPQRVDLSEAKSSPGTFKDAFLSLSLLGDRQVFLVDPADELSLKFLQQVFNDTHVANFVVIQADNLGKTSKLRAACEASEMFACLAIYEEDPSRLSMRVQKLLSANALQWGEDAEDSFFTSVGSDRSIVLQEAEKLILYMMGQNEITVSDVAAICGDTAAFDADQLIDAVLSGDLETTDRIITSFGGDTRSLFALLQLHVAKLQGFRADMERGTTADLAVKNAKPPVFFKRKPAIMNQLRILSMLDLIEIQDTIAQLTLQSRKNAALAEAMNNRALLSLARLARSRQ